MAWCVTGTGRAGSISEGLTSDTSDTSDRHVKGWIDLGGPSGLFAKQSQRVQAQPLNYVLNGIAHDAASDRLFVTGKQWDFM